MTNPPRLLLGLRNHEKVLLAICIAYVSDMIEGQFPAKKDTQRYQKKKICLSGGNMYICNIFMYKNSLPKTCFSSYDKISALHKYIKFV